MAKTYISSVKYLIKIKFEVQGVVDKPDIIGAIFGQSEGLLGDEMDLKELQKNGKIGRIEIIHENVLGKTKGDILLPSNMDMVQTSILAAAVESVEKVGPYESKFRILSLEDTRTEKRDEIKRRAQELLEKFKSTVETDSVEITESVREETRAAGLKIFGPEKLAAGPEVEPSKEIIVVEGRADVITLLKNHIKNVIAMQGSTIPKSIIQLARTKKITLFVDGDRGGEMIAKNFLLNAKAEFIARAPDGKEVEELTRKEIIQSIRRKIGPKEFFDRLKKPIASTLGTGFRTNTPYTPIRRQPESSFSPYPQTRRPFSPHSQTRRPFGNRRDNRFSPQNSRPRYGMQPPPIDLEHLPTKEEQEKYLPLIKELKGKSKAKIFNEKMKEIGNVEVKNLVSELGKKKDVFAVVFDGIVTNRLVASADKNNIKFVVGIRKGKIEKSKTRVLTFSN